ncbi:MAG: DUF4258 domain-containing protein [Actinobacteria bacterium]|nr:DUF4258 domain-containing protein [Actinomycetota bacterium]
MEVIFIEHALERMLERGTNADEVRKVLEIGDRVQAKQSRNAKEAVFDYGSEWLGREFKQKKVKAIYAEEADQLTVITVYVYYGEWD